jgi:hypothetical protein
MTSLMAFIVDGRRGSVQEKSQGRGKVAGVFLIILYHRPSQGTLERLACPIGYPIRIKEPKKWLACTQWMPPLQHANQNAWQIEGRRQAKCQAFLEVTPTILPKI